MKPAILGLFLACGLLAQDQHVAWKLSVEPPSAPPGAKVLLRMAGRIDEGWHLYSMSTPAAIPTKIQLAPNPAIAKIRFLQPKPKRAFDANFSSDTETYEGDVAFLLELELAKDAPAGPTELSVSARYQTCNPNLCVPSKWTGSATLTVDPAAASTAVVIPAGYSEPPPPPAASSSSAPSTQPEGLLAFLAVAFGFGLASIFTPCVFPMIPITMSYFLNRQSGGRRESIVQALVFCLGIVVLFSGLGLATTAILGPFGIVTLGSNPWVNAFISVLFIAFGLSLLGAFEITIPSVILTRLNQSADQGGFIGSLLMGLTFSLASFACVGPFVGTLLAASVSGGKTRPLIGMVTFATGLALPFFLLAVFPSYLKRMPRSGGWMARVKVVMGFIILAASLKYLSSLDQVLQLGFLTRERFLAAWIVLFAMAGLYLLGFLRLEGIKPDETMGLGRLLSGIALLIFAISLRARHVRRQARRSRRLRSPRHAVHRHRRVVGRRRKRARVDEESVSRGPRPRPPRRQARARQLHRLCLHQLSLDEGQHVHPAGDRRRHEELRPGGTLYRRHRPGIRGQSETPARQIQYRGDSLLRHPRSRREGPRHLPGLHQQRLGISRLPEQTGAAGPRRCERRRSRRRPAPASGIPKATKLDGGPVDTAALSGKVVVVNFWATWCVPCIREIPSFNKLHNEFSEQGVAVLGVNGG